MSYAAPRYSALSADRQPYLWRARACARLTIPALFPEETATAGTSYTTPYQSIGARGVNNLAAKMLLSLLPPNSPFFRLELDDETQEKLQALEQSQGEGGDFKAKFDAALARYANRVHRQMEVSVVRSSGIEVFKQLLVAGNCLSYYPDKGPARFYRLDKYVVWRNPSGDTSEIILAAKVDPTELEPDVQALLSDGIRARLTGDPQGRIDPVTLYTIQKRDGKRWRTWQEVESARIPGSDSTYPEDAPPYHAHRLVKADSEHYGRSYVEEYFGDLKSLEGLEKAILHGAAAAAKLIFLVNPNGVTQAKTIAEAESGAVRTGLGSDVTTLQADKYGDFRAALEKSRDLQARLAQAFLMNTSIQRTGERVTAEEIRYMARELEDALGGLYSTMAQEYQLPLVNRQAHILRRRGRLPSLDGKPLRPVVMTGLEALGRGQDLARINELFATNPPAVDQQLGDYLDVNGYLTRKGVALGVDTKGLIRSDKEVGERRGAAQQQEVMRTLIDKGTGPLAKAAMEQGSPQTDMEPTE